MSDQFNYFFRFNSFAQAASDPVIAPYLVPTTAPLQPLTVFDASDGNSIIALSGYWLMILAPANIAALLGHRNLQFVTNRNLQFSSPATSVTANNVVPPLKVSSLEILTGVGITYCNPGLDGVATTSDWILATGFWNDNGFWRDNASWID